MRIFSLVLLSLIVIVSDGIADQKPGQMDKDVVDCHCSSDRLTKDLELAAITEAKKAGNSASDKALDTAPAKPKN